MTVILEAMALGVPIVSTPTDGLRDLINHGMTGYLSDEDDILVDYIISLIQNKELHQQMSRNALEASRRMNDKKAYITEICHVLYE